MAVVGALFSCLFASRIWNTSLSSISNEKEGKYQLDDCSKKLSDLSEGFLGKLLESQYEHCNCQASLI